MRYFGLMVLWLPPVAIGLEQQWITTFCISFATLCERTNNYILVSVLLESTSGSQCKRRATITCLTQVYSTEPTEVTRAHQSWCRRWMIALHINQSIYCSITVDTGQEPVNPHRLILSAQHRTRGKQSHSKRSRGQ